MLLLLRRLFVLAFCLGLLTPSAEGRSRPRHAAHLTEPTKASRGLVLRGRASWYGRQFQGRRTTSGERFNRFDYTCAHKTLPFGTRLRVTNPTNGKSVVVRVTDRGPFRHQRIIDLAEVAARPLNIICCGSATVIAEVVPATTPLGPTVAPANLAALRAADPAPKAPFTTYEVPAAEPTFVAAVSPTDRPAAVVVTGAIPASNSAATTVATAAYIVQAGTFANVVNAQAVLARIQALDTHLQVRIATETVAGQVLNRVLIGHFADRPEAEAVRRRLQVWGIGGLVREIAGL